MLLYGIVWHSYLESLFFSLNGQTLTETGQTNIRNRISLASGNVKREASANCKSIEVPLEIESNGHRDQITDCVI